MILRDGKVSRPLKLWHGSLQDEDGNTIQNTEATYLVDGHNRWRIIQQHPEIPYETELLEAPSMWAAISWMYKNQRGQRNLNDWWQGEINALIVEAEMKSVGAPRNNKNAEKQLDPAGPIVSDGKSKSTVAKVAQEIDVPEGTLKKQLATHRGLDAGEKVSPGFKARVISGEIKASKKDVRALRLMEPEERKEAVEAIKNPSPKTPTEQKSDYAKSRELSAAIRKTSADMASVGSSKYTQSDLISELRVIRDEFIDKVKNTLKVRKSVIGSGEKVIEVLVSCEKRIIEIENQIGG